jgi:hypothetical protein
MASLGRCVIESVIGGGSTPTAVTVYTTSWTQASRAVGGLPLAHSGEGAAYLIWVTGDLHPQYVPISPNPAGEVSAVWLVEPPTRSTASGSGACAGSDTGEITAGSASAPGMLGPPTFMPPEDYAAPPPPSSP